MTVPIFIGIAALLFIIGIVFVVKGISSEEETAVPISNPREIRDLKKAFTPSATDQSKVSMPPESTKTEQSQGNQFMEENHQLRKENLEEKGRSEQLKERIEAMKKEYDQAAEQKEEAIRVLKEENSKFKAEKEQVSLNDGLLDEFKSKTALLEKQYDESQKQKEEMTAMIEQLKTEKNDLVAQAKLKENQFADQMKAQAIEAHKNELEVLTNKLMGSISAIEALKRENKDLKQSNLDLKEEFAKTEELNAHLMKKEKMMQYELTKNRAQSLGLEKICADFRTRIETMAGSATTNM